MSVTESLRKLFRYLGLNVFFIFLQSRGDRSIRTDTWSGGRHTITSHAVDLEEISKLLS